MAITSGENEDTTLIQTDVDVSRNSRLVRQGDLNCSEQQNEKQPSAAPWTTQLDGVGGTALVAAAAAFVGCMATVVSMAGVVCCCGQKKKLPEQLAGGDACSQKTEAESEEESFHSYEEVKAAAAAKLAVIPLPQDQDYITMSYSGTIV